MIAEVALLDTGQAPNDRRLGLQVPQALQPIDIEILLTVGRQVALDLVHGNFRLLTNKEQGHRAAVDSPDSRDAVTTIRRRWISQALSGIFGFALALDIRQTVSGE